MVKRKTATIDDVIITRAAGGDLAAIQALLAKSKLPPDDVGEHLDNFLVARRAGKIAGTVGLEVYGSNALLRSLAVEESERNKGMAKSLYDELLIFARDRGVRQISLLTTTAEGYFAKLGFTRVNKDEIPGFVKNTKEYQEFCPSNAVCMVKRI